jgi:outer membrane protein OmpA-like peptidoglycan-associated protein
MSKRWASYIVMLVVFGITRIAEADLTNPATIGHGSVVVGGFDDEVGVITSNVGGTGEELHHLHETGANCARFVVTPERAFPAMISSGGSPGSLDFSVRFSPTATGAVNCTYALHAMDHTVITGSQPMVVSGTGINPPIIDAPATATATSVRHNDAAVTSTSNFNIVVQNDGGQTLAISSLSTGGNTEFVVVSPTTFPVNVAPTATTTITVRFDPNQQGLRSATLTIASNDPVTPMDTVALSGTGLNGVIAVTDEAFGIVNLGATGLQDIAATNNAPQFIGPLNLDSATITQGSTWFSFDTNGAFGCLNQTTCNFGATGVPAPRNIRVRCVPPGTASGTQMATVTFTSDTDGGGDAVANLTCTAGRADAVVVPTTIAFGDVAVGSNSVVPVDVTNTGNINLTVAVVEAPSVASVTEDLTGTSPVPGGMTNPFTVRFAPVAPGLISLTLNVNTNDPDTASIPIMITGRGVAPAIQGPANVAFGDVEVGAAPTQVITITNNGTAPLAITSANSSGAAYSVTAGNTGAQSVPVDGSAQWTVACTPTGPAAFTGNFTIASNAFNDPSFVIPLTCTGREGVLAVTPMSIAFGGIPENTTDERTFTLSNTGNLPVSNIAATFSNATLGYSIDPTTPVPASLAVGGSVMIDVIFAPLAGGPDGGPATLTFTGTWGAINRPLRTPAVLSITGDGLQTGFAATPATVDFGSFRFDGTQTRTFCILNTGDANVEVKNPINIAPMTGTTSGEFTITSIRDKVAGATPCANGPTGGNLTLPQTLLPNEALEVAIIANPDNRTGPMGATVTITSQLPAPNTTRTVTLVGVSTSAMIAVEPGETVDFGPVDIQGTPPSRMIPVVIRNTGNGPLNLGAVSRNDGGSNTHFMLTLPTARTLQPNETLTINVTYAPTMVASDEIVLSHTVGGVLGNPGNQTIVLRGEGIDRELAVEPTLDFPATFRNPGSAAPVRPVTVMNMGKAPLVVSAAMLDTTGQPEMWELVDGSAVTIPPSASHDFLVRFVPSMSGAFGAELVLTNDDLDEGMARITLAGAGMNRAVDFGPEIDVGLTGIGIPITREDILRITSMDPSNDFTISAIEIEGAEGFSLGDPAEGLLPAGGTRDFDIVFAPEEQGEFEATAILYLDEDPTGSAMVTIRGRAVFVDARGGGGCATGHDLGGGLLLIIGAIVLRRRRAMLAALAAVVVIPFAARADDLVLSVFDPTPATTAHTFQLQSPEVGNNGDWAASAVFSLATKPLVLDAFSNGTLQNDAIVVDRSTLIELGGAYAFLDRFEAGARMPLYSQNGEARIDSPTEFTTDPASGTARGDLTLHGKVRLVKTGTFSLAGGLHLTLPTASEGQFTGIDKPSVRPMLLAALYPDTLARRITLSANVGGVLRATSRYANLEQGSGLAWGLATTIRVLDRLWFSAEVFGDVVPSGKQDEMATKLALSPSEWLAGLRYRPDHRFSIGIAGGRGLTSAAGSPEIRGVLALSFSPGAPELKPIHPPPPPKIDGDPDGDGLLDSVDKCDNEAEDKDMFEDDDGCPDPDNDGDKVVDAQDKCPLDREDIDGFQDLDGCPDKDNDEDGVSDDKDMCPNEAEDRDGFKDIDGCPEPDNDRDGILDGADKCPDKPETINGKADGDGCPDAGDSSVVLSPDRLEILDSIQFIGATAKISRASFNVLGQIAATLRAHPEIIRLRVTAHVHPTSDLDRDVAKDQDLSDKRAQAVRDWLVQWGIASGRVEARGFGGSKPLVNDRKKGALINNRVELIILERK